MVAAVWALGLGEGSIERTVSNPGLRATLVGLLAHLDLGWIALAAANVYLSLATQVGLATARRWALLILFAVTALAWLGVATGFPLGRIHYGSALGLKVGPVPFGLPLLWFSIIIGTRETILRFRPRWGQWGLSASAGALAMLTDMNLEAPAAKLRGFWFWSPLAPDLPPVFDFPLTGSLAWGLLAALIALNLRELDVVNPVRKRPWPPMVTLAIFQAIFLATHVT